MIEPELSFAGLSENISLAEAFLKYIISYVLESCAGDIAFFEKQYEAGLQARLKRVIESKFLRVSYTQAVEDLIKSGHIFDITPKWGLDLGTEHERFLTENIYKQPIVVYDYPVDIKAFYMKANKEDLYKEGKTVAAMDVLVPKIGEIIGGSQREENLDILSQKIKAKGLNVEDYKWYLDLRRYGTVPHSGFGLGFERMVMFVTGMENIRDVIPYPRYPGHAEF
jgi:asparaginyl-tRNA synthetase